VFRRRGFGTRFGWWCDLAGRCCSSNADVVLADLSPGTVRVGHATNLGDGLRGRRRTSSENWCSNCENEESGVEDHFDCFDRGFWFFDLNKTNVRLKERLG